MLTNRRKKVIACVVEYLSLIAGICSLMFCITIAGSDMDLKSGMGKTYLNSDKYEQEVRESISRLYDYLHSRSNFESNKKYDPERIVDVTDYSRWGSITGEITHGVAYYLKDLLHWSKIGIQTEYKTSNAPFRENYAPIGYTGIADYTIQNKEDASLFYCYLEDTIEKIWEDVQQYNKGKICFADKNTNLKYKVYDSSDLLLHSNTDLSETEIKNLGNYVIVDYKTLQFETNLSEKNAVYDALVEGISSEYLESRVVIGIDTSFPVQDAFYEMNEKFEILMPVAGAMVIVCGLSLILWQASIAYLGYLTGKRKREDEIREIDKLSFEGLTLIMVTVGGLGIYIACICYKGLGLFQAAIGILSGVAGLTNGVLLVWFMSLIRRIKSGNFARYSFFCHMVKELKGTLNRRKLMIRVLLWYCGFLMINILCISTIIYLEKWGVLITLVLDLGVGLILIKNAMEQNKLVKGIHNLLEGDFNRVIDSTGMNLGNKELADSVNLLSDGLKQIIAENIKNERMKTDLITNVSHDIKTPLTSIINYVDLMKNLHLEDKKANAFLAVLDKKSQRLKLLTEDLVEASRISSGMVKLEYMNISFKELIMQTNGEFLDKFAERDLELIVSMPEDPVVVRGDSRRMWRVLENLYGNVSKYAQMGTRVYVNVKTEQRKMYFSIKNVSEQSLNVDAGDLTERFVRGDLSRTTEGSGLGLSIAKSLTEIQNGEFSVYLDGDLFKVTISFPTVQRNIVRQE